jgi:hypothetical protein
MQISTSLGVVQFILLLLLCYRNTEWRMRLDGPPITTRSQRRRRMGCSFAAVGRGDELNPEIPSFFPRRALTGQSGLVGVSRSRA